MINIVRTHIDRWLLLDSMWHKGQQNNMCRVENIANDHYY